MKIGWETSARKDLDEADDSTNMYILGSRFGIGDEGLPRNTVLACELYEAAAKVQTPILGGHPSAMLHLALHYESGIGVSNGQDHEKAFALYKAVIDHPFPGEENVSPAFVALSRYHKNGWGGAKQCEELAAKYTAFSESNAENIEQFRDLENWWNNPSNREKWYKYNNNKTKQKNNSNGNDK
mmetsp:Transcript_61755/g.69936  ORF Transcript_61755/g.69936 Transcript_61755/m.69936 type:complete len:183 (-) Transcript_61755:41-589(-)